MQKQCPFYINLMGSVLDVTVFFGQQYLKHREVYFLDICLPTSENIYRVERQKQYFKRFKITVLKESVIREMFGTSIFNFISYSSP